MELANLDSDTDMEIIVGDGTIVSMSCQGHLTIFESDGTQTWQSSDLGKTVTRVKAADMDGDGNMECEFEGYNLE